MTFLPGSSVYAAEEEGLSGLPPPVSGEIEVALLDVEESDLVFYDLAAVWDATGPDPPVLGRFSTIAITNNDSDDTIDHGFVEGDAGMTVSEDGNVGQLKTGDDPSVSSLASATGTPSDDASPVVLLAALIGTLVLIGATAFFVRRGNVLTPSAMGPTATTATAKGLKSGSQGRVTQCPGLKGLGPLARLVSMLRPGR
ncbi:hypothetical protein ACFL06_00370 [Patescibacteria group bacterium]